MCRRAAQGAYKSSTDNQGSPYYLHRLATPLANVDALIDDPQRADIATLNQIYSALLGALTLLPVHRDYLQRRRLDDHEIATRGYASAAPT